MRAYELMVLIDPEVDERTVEPTLAKFLDVVRNDGGTICMPVTRRFPSSAAASAAASQCSSRRQGASSASPWSRHSTAL